MENFDFKKYLVEGKLLKEYWDEDYANEENEYDEEEVYDKAFSEHVQMLKIFVENVLDLSYDDTNINLGQSDGEENEILFISSKIYGDNPTLFTTYHQENNGKLIDYEYIPFKPLNFSPEEIENILTKNKLKRLGI
jgi:hypothetical protein